MRPGSLRTIAILLAAFPLAAIAGAVASPARAAIVPATDLGVPGDDSRALAINNAGRIVVDYDTFGSGGTEVWLPPHPGGGSIPLCTSSCFQRIDWAQSIGTNGRVVGSFFEFGSGGPYASQPATWSATGTLTLLPTGIFDGDLAEQPIFAEGINTAGTIVGTQVVGPGNLLPARWGNPLAPPATLPNDGLNHGPYPKAINDARIIVGHTEGIGAYAAVWDPSAGHALASLPLLPSGTHARAKDISAGGFIVGTGDDATGDDTGMLWVPGAGGSYTAVALPRLASGQLCEATAVNDVGQAVGRCTDGGGVQRGIVWSLAGPAVLHELAPLPGDTELTVRDVNNAGQVVGWSSATELEAVLWVYATGAAVPALPPWGWLLLLPAWLGAWVRWRR